MRFSLTFAGTRIPGRVKSVSELLDLDISEVQIWSLTYVVNLDKSPHVDLESPAQRTFLSRYKWVP